jgi:hypothetical protein
LANKLAELGGSRRKATEKLERRTAASCGMVPIFAQLHVRVHILVKFPTVVLVPVAVEVIARHTAGNHHRVTYNLNLVQAV